MEGYDAKFYPPLEKRLECPICLLAQREPMQTPCGHRFCSACILRALRETGPSCPVDKTRLCQHHLFKDNFAKREVLSLNVHCPADDHGCGWQGELRELEEHTKLCDLVIVSCPHLCNHTCHKKDLSVHLVTCPNKPNRCPSCSIRFPKDKIVDHAPLCSKIILSDSAQDTVFKANEVLKWIGHLKLRLNGQNVQVTGYLSVKAETEESFMFTGIWSNALDVIPLNSGAAKIFWKMLLGPEVQPHFFNFAVINAGDPGAATFLRMIKKKMDSLHAAVGLRLREMNRRDLTLIYFYWSDQKKRLMACVAEINCHLVRQIQSRLQMLHQSRSRRARHSRSSRPAAAPPYSPSTGPIHPTHPHIHSQLHQHMAHQRTHHFAPHLHPHHAHPVQPPANINVHVVNVPPSRQRQQEAASGSSAGVLPSLLSWQMSQSLNTFPWRMQPAGVPFFTIPSTPPQFLPANPYPYTFAPMPAAPFISPMPPVNVPSSVPLPPYTGIAVPQGIPGEHTVTLAPANTGTLGGPHPASFAVPTATLQPLATAGTESEVPTVTVTLNGVNPIDPNTATIAAAVPVGVLSQATIDGTSHVPIVQGQYPADFSAPNPPSGVVQAEVRVAARVAGFAHGSNTVSVVRQPHDQPSVGTAPSRSSLHSARESEAGAYVVRLVTSRDEDNNLLHVAPSTANITFSPVSSTPSDSPSSDLLGWDTPGPLSARFDSALSSDSDSSVSSSPAAQFSSFSPLASSGNDSPGLDSPFASFASAVNESVISSDSLSDQESTMNQSDSETPPRTDSALHTLANAAAILADSSEVGGGDIHEPQNHFSLVPNRSSTSVRTSSANRVQRYVSNPPVIHVDSDSDSHVASPSSIIDLTQSPLSLSPPADRVRSLHPSRHFENERSTFRSPDSGAPLLMPVIQLASGSAMDHESSTSGRTRQYIREANHAPLQRPLPAAHVHVATAARHVSVNTHSRLHSHPLQTVNPSQMPMPPQPEFVNAAAVPVLSWPYEHTESSNLAAAATHHPVLTAPVFAPAAIATRPPGNFWDTVMPSLDISLQNGSTEIRGSHH